MPQSAALVVFLTGLLSYSAAAQHASCGLEPSPADLARLDAAAPPPLPGGLLLRPSLDTIDVPVRFHRLARADGTGAASVAQVDAALAELNAAFAEGQIRFTRCAGDDLVADSTFFDFDGADDEAALMREHATDLVLDVFVANSVRSPGGGQVCGYARLPPQRFDAVLVRKSCLTGGTTLAHEIGHYLGLLHTHGTSNCGTTDELVDGSNCATAGDRVCDTPADPNLLVDDCSTYEVDADCVYTGERRDANGEPYDPDTRNIMSYSRAQCDEHLTAGQLERARYYLAEFRGYLACVTCDEVSAAPQLAAVSYRFAEFTVPGAGDADRIRVEYAVAGEEPAETTVTGGAFRRYGDPCDSLTVRTRRLCGAGEAPWSAPVGARLAGCGLAYCPQLHSPSRVLAGDLHLAGATLPAVSAVEGYALHELPAEVTVAAAQATFSLRVTPTPTDAAGKRPVAPTLEVWLDADRDGALASAERIYAGEAPAGRAADLALALPPELAYGVAYRLRVAVNAGPLLEDACSGEGSGETHDVDLVFAAAPHVAWAADTVRLGPDGTAAEVELAADRRAGLAGESPWLAFPDSADGPAVAVGASVHIGCEPRVATLTATAAGVADELIVVQAPPEAGIVVAAHVDTVGPRGGSLTLRAESAHAFASLAPAWLAGLTTDDLVGDTLVAGAYGPNLTGEARVAEVTWRGCGVEVATALTQLPQRTRWIDTASVSAGSVAVERAVASNVPWSVSADAAWIEVEALAPTGALDFDGAVRVGVADGAPAGASGYVTLLPSVGSVAGGDRIRVVAPRISGVVTRERAGELRVVNPVGERLRAWYPGGGGPRSAAFAFTLANATGAEVLRARGSHLDVDVADLARGVYLLEVRDVATGRRVAARRVVR